MLGRDMVRLVEVTSVLPVPGGAAPPGSGTWKVAWVESTYPRAPGVSRTEAAWEAYVTTRIVPPATLDRITINPIGLYVTSIAWTQVGSRAWRDSTAATTDSVQEVTR
jgi:type IV secretory pathway TrbF-like protein